MLREKYVDGNQTRDRKNIPAPRGEKKAYSFVDKESFCKNLRCCPWLRCTWRFCCSSNSERTRPKTKKRGSQFFHPLFLVYCVLQFTSRLYVLHDTIVAFGNQNPRRLKAIIFVFWFRAHERNNSAQVHGAASHVCTMKNRRPHVTFFRFILLLLLFLFLFCSSLLVQSIAA